MRFPATLRESFLPIQAHSPHGYKMVATPPASYADMTLFGQRGESFFSHASLEYRILP
jgi:hypothetical protein